MNKKNSRNPARISPPAFTRTSFEPKGVQLAMSDIVAAAPEVGWQEDPGVNSGDTTNDDGLFLEALHDLQSLNINADETFKRPAETRCRPTRT